MRKHASLLAVLMLCFAFAFAQTRTITGQVKDSKGDPVPFANITIKGTTTGLAADASGNFKVDVKEGQTLVISSTSFTQQEIKIGNQTSIVVTLQSQGNLHE